MRNRRLSLALLAAAGIGAACWLLSDGLTAEERQLVGTWAYEDWQARGSTRTAEFHSDGTCRCPTDAAPGGMTCWWSVRHGAVVFDTEPSRLRRTFRPVARALGLSVRPVFPAYPVELTAGRLVIYSPDGTPTVYTRYSAD